MGSEDALIGFTTIFLLFGTPLLIAVLIFVGWLISSNRKSHEVASARESYERLVRDKLDVIKTAIAMGQSDDEIRALDARLERLIGTDKLKDLLDGRSPQPPVPAQDLKDIDLLAEADRQSRLKTEEL